MKMRLKEGKFLLITREGKDLREGQVQDFGADPPDDVMELVGEFLEEVTEESVPESEKPVSEEPVEEQPVLETP